MHSLTDSMILYLQAFVGQTSSCPLWRGFLLQCMVCHAVRPCSQRPEVSCCSADSQPVQLDGPDISRLDVALQQQWDHAANAHLGCIVIKPHSNIKVWWMCDQCPDGHLHSWEARIDLRTRGSGCPQCIGRKVCKHNSLATKAPLAAAQWDYEANDGTPDSLMAQSNQLVGWLCDACGHKWSQTPNNRVCKHKGGCPQCARRRRCMKHIKHPTFAECQDPRGRAVLAEWDHDRNALQGNFPQNTTLQSSKQIFWLCTKCPAGQEHSWAATPNHRMGRSKSGCPFCTGKAACKCNSLQALYPAIATSWDHAKNQGQPSDYTASSTFLAWWSSPQRGSWQQSIDSRTKQVREGPARLIRIQQRQLLVSGP